MTYRTLDIQLNVDDLTRPLGDSAYIWLSSLVKELTPIEVAELADLPAATKLDPNSDRPQGGAGELYGLIEVSRSIDGSYPTNERRNASSEGWSWLHSELVDIPYKAKVEFGRFDADGSLGAVIVSVSVTPLWRSPNWLVLQAVVPVKNFTDTVTGPAQQRRWLQALRATAGQLNPGFGHIDYRRDKGRTALERYSAAPGIPIEQRDPQRSIAYSRKRARGYSWLTILSEEVAAKLGGQAKLSATGAFAEVERLAAGGLWLLATPDFTEWGTDAAGAVFQALAPVLPPGKPVPRSGGDEPPTYLVFADPSI
jgi:hypothetical protein